MFSILMFLCFRILRARHSTWYTLAIPCPSMSLALPMQVLGHLAVLGICQTSVFWFPVGTCHFCHLVLAFPWFVTHSQSCSYFFVLLQRLLLLSLLGSACVCMSFAWPWMDMLCHVHSICISVVFSSACYALLSCYLEYILLLCLPLLWTYCSACSALCLILLDLHLHSCFGFTFQGWLGTFGYFVVLSCFGFAFPCPCSSWWLSLYTGFHLPFSLVTLVMACLQGYLPCFVKHPFLKWYPSLLYYLMVVIGWFRSFLCHVLASTWSCSYHVLSCFLCLCSFFIKLGYDLTFLLVIFFTFEFN